MNALKHNSHGDNMFERELEAVTSKYDRKAGERDLLKKQLEDNNKSLEAKIKEVENVAKAKEVVQLAAESTQKKMVFHINNLVSMALAAVFPDPYTFEMKFEPRRGKTEADLLFSKNDSTTDDILNTGGGGPADVSSFALRLSTWSIRKTRHTIILDEPFRFLSRDLQPRASAMIKHLSEKLGLQLIIVSHIPEIIDNADNVININDILKPQQTSKLRRRHR